MTYGGTSLSRGSNIKGCRRRRSKPLLKNGAPNDISISFIGQQGRDKWMTAEQKVGLAAWRSSEEFKKSSAQKNKNRASCGDDGAPAGTHAMGHISAIQYTERLAAQEFDGQASPIANFVTKAKTTKTSNFVSQKAKKIMEAFMGKKKTVAATQSATPIDDNNLYYEAAGGHNKGSHLRYWNGRRHVFWTPSLFSW